jgi:hypothetical protein
MNENNGKELVPQRGPPGEVSPSYEASAGKRNSAGGVGLPTVGGIPYAGGLPIDAPPNPKRERFLSNLEVACCISMMGIAAFSAMDASNWSIARAGRTMMHSVPFGIGDKAMELTAEAADPMYRSRPGETPEETQRRRSCIDAILFKDGDVYVVAQKSHPRAPLDFCETPTAPNSGKDRGSLTK